MSDGLVSLGRNSESDMDDTHLYLGSVFEVKEHERLSHTVSWVFIC